MPGYPLSLLGIYNYLDAQEPQPISAQSGLDWSMANVKIKLILDINFHPFIVRRVFQN